MSSADMSKSMMNNSADIVDELNEKEPKDQVNPDELNFETLKDLTDIKWLLQNQVCGIPFNTNILRMSLNCGEEMIAQMLVANYKVAIDHKMMVRSIKTRQMKFLYCVYAFNQNYEYIGERKQEKGSDSDSDDKQSQKSEEEMDEADKYHTFTYDYLIKQILENCEDEAA